MEEMNKVIEYYSKLFGIEPSLFRHLEGLLFLCEEQENASCYLICYKDERKAIIKYDSSLKEKMSQFIQETSLENLETSLHNLFSVSFVERNIFVLENLQNKPSMNVRRLTKKDFKQYLIYYKNAYPSVSLKDSKLKSIYDGEINKLIYTAYFLGEKIVSVSDSRVFENSRNLTNIDVFTLPEYRRRGFAYETFNEAIKLNLEQGMYPIFETVNNFAKENLAKKSGYIKMGKILVFQE